VLEILKNNFVLALYAITWIFSIIKLPKYFDSTLKYLPIIIGYTLFNEILGALIYNIEDFTLFSEEEYSSYTLFIYNIYDLIFFSFFFYIYWKSIANNGAKTKIKNGALLFILSLVVNAIIVNPMKYELWYAYVIGSIFLIISSILYLKSLKLKSGSVGISTNLLFWISIGLLIFHVGYMPITIYKNSNLNITVDDYANVKIVHIALIVIMYTCFIIGFLRMKRFKLA